MTPLRLERDGIRATAVAVTSFGLSATSFVVLLDDGSFDTWRIDKCKFVNVLKAT